ncbi:D-alanyl-lipoteichoic acid biosynthesis protein DltD [Lachnobacterium bovis]|uniref:D-alanyl-lipoteichoic acid biosynthesis protein DltD n=1 Tax=Lachnobacterium bovis TaxID=140626 RepID=UPI0004863DD0|nr:D-alanyl-lipoteichoic acid biosynthesis protein DltD [Lachnobacterium bovis]
MKKIKAFIVAALLFTVFLVIFEISLSYKLYTDDKSMGMWNSAYKDRSYEAICQNINDSTMMICGSSEFAHGRNSKYHPMNMCPKESKNWMTIGSSYNQTLLHGIAVGSVGKQMNGKKVVMLLSPTWFYKKGISGEHFELRFSETEYYHFMENKTIPRDIKEYYAKRSKKLLAKNDGLQSKVELCNSINLDKNDSKIAKFRYNFYKDYARQKDYITVKTAYNLDHKLYNKGLKKKYLNKGEVKFDDKKMLARATRSSKRKSHNDFTMRDSNFSKLEMNILGLKNSHEKDSWEVSKEYKDLEYFIRLCNSQNIDLDIVLLPVNGRWYDYTGMDKGKREVLSKNLSAITSKYNVRLDDLSEYSYDKYLTSDAVHPWNLGWVVINERLYNFYKGGKS